MSFSVAGHRLTKRYRYFDVDFENLRARYGNEFIERVCFHIMALEAIPLASFQPTQLDLGPFARFHSARFERLWRTIFIKAGAEWRYQNSLPNYQGPSFPLQRTEASFAPVCLEVGPIETLCFCGGGKDSLAAMKLFESAGLSFSSYSYSHPAYGATEKQFALIDSLLDANTPERRHRVEIETNSVADGGGLCAETPISIFGALPVALQHGYRSLVLGNERSADEPNLKWLQTGEFVNHQWGKSLEAELLISAYVREQLISNLHCFSVLRPMHDPVIFSFLRRFPDAVKNTHSCNHKKPWCFECAKCAYVGLGFTAYLPRDLARQIVPSDLFDNPANQLFFRQLLGLEAHKPFECVGEAGEARLALEICRARGLCGHAVELCVDPALDPVESAKSYCEIAPPAACFPPDLWRSLSPLMLNAGHEAFNYISSACSLDHALAGVAGISGRT